MVMNTRTALRNEVIKAIKETYNEKTGRKLSDSDARAMLRGETDTESYRMAFNIAREYGLDDF